MDPVWTLFSRRTFSRLTYWLSALGYDLRDRSFTNWIYLIYFCAFWFVWVFAVFALLGSGVASIFDETQILSPPQVAVTLAEYVLIIWALVKFWQVSKRSPFVFNEEDAYLLCQTPVNRRKVGLVWFLQGIIGAFFPFAAGTVILSFALVEWRMQGETTVLMIIEYLKASLLAIILIMPTQIGWQAALWGLGALRLRQRREPAWLRPFFLGAVLFFLASFFFSGLQSILVAPLSLPLKAAFMEDVSTSDRLGSLGLGFLYFGAGLVFLSAHSGKINLSRAAQETSHIAMINQARSFGQSDLVDTILLRRRLGMTRTSSRLLKQPRGNILCWKDLLQSLRTLRLQDVFNLAWIFGLSLGMFRSSNWPLQMLIAGIWTISIGGFTTKRLRSDLASWWLLRSLPLRPGEILKYEVALTCGMSALIGWLALALSNLTTIFSLYAAVLLPIFVANAAMAAAQDILRHSKARILMSPSLAEENVPRQNIWGVIQGLISVLIPFGILILASKYLSQPIWGSIAFLMAVLITWLNRKVVLAAYRWIE